MDISLVRDAWGLELLTVRVLALCSLLVIGIPQMYEAYEYMLTTLTLAGNESRLNRRSSVARFSNF